MESVLVPMEMTFLPFRSEKSCVSLPSNSTAYKGENLLPPADDPPGQGTLADMSQLVLTTPGNF